MKKYTSMLFLQGEDIPEKFWNIPGDEQLIYLLDIAGYMTDTFTDYEEPIYGSDDRLIHQAYLGINYIIASNYNFEYVSLTRVN